MKYLNFADANPHFKRNVVHVAVPAVQILFWHWVCKLVGSRDSVVGIATRYGLDGPGIESQWGRDFPQLSRPALRPTQLLIQWVPGLCRG
jgi:hypothetical protein